MDNKLNLAPEVIEAARAQSRKVMMLLEQFNKAIGEDASPEVFVNQLPLLKEISSSLLILEQLNPAQTSANERNSIREQVLVEDGMSVRDNLKGLMMAFAVVGMACPTKGQKMRTSVVYFPLIAEFAEMYQNELTKSE